MDLCRNTSFATEVTMQPLERYPHLDAAILFSDILTIPDAMDLGLNFLPGEGPTFSDPLIDESSVHKLDIPSMEKLSYVFDAVRSIKDALQNKVPLIGFAGSPWTLATYMVEGKGGTDFLNIKKMAYERDDLMHHILKINAETVSQYLAEQIKAGADAVMIFDSWGGVLSPRDYKEFSLTYMQKIVDGLIRENDGRKVPVTLFTKNGGLNLEAIAATGCDAVGLDWTVDIADARRRIGDKVALQGNMDPAMLHGTPERIRQEVQRILEGYGDGTGHVFNLGHGITPEVDPENAGVFINSVGELSKQYHNK